MSEPNHEIIVAEDRPCRRHDALARLGELLDARRVTVRPRGAGVFIVPVQTHRGGRRRKGGRR
jgi:hypothetical protein